MRVDGQLTFNTSIAMVSAAIAGLGVGYIPESLVLDQLRDGSLVQILEDWTPGFSGYHLYYPSRRQHSPAFTVIVDALRERQWRTRGADEAGYRS